MSVLSPEDRALFWGSVLRAEGEEHEAMVHALAEIVLSSLGSEFDLYGGYSDVTVQTFELLDRCGLLERAELRHAFESTDEAEEAGLALIVQMCGALRDAATT